MTYNKVAAFGCSFTSGEELLHHTIRQDADEVKRAKGPIYWQENFGPQCTALEQDEATVGWAGQVAKSLRLPFKSYAERGSSLGWSVYQLEQAIFSNDIDHNTLVLFGATNVNRIVHFNDTEWPKTYLLSLGEYSKDHDWDPKTVLEIYNDSMLLWDYFNAIDKLMSLNAQYSNIHLFDMPGLKLSNYSMHQHLRKYFTKRLEVLGYNSNVHFDRSFVSYCKSQSDLHGNGHPKIHIHKKFAEHVLNLLD